MYNLQEPISSSIFSFKTFVFNHNIVQFYCVNSPLKDYYHAHIVTVTGDFRIMKSNKLRKMFLKGPKYCGPRELVFNQVRENIVNGIKHCIPVWQA